MSNPFGPLNHVADVPGTQRKRSEENRKSDGLGQVLQVGWTSWRPPWLLLGKPLFSGMMIQGGLNMFKHVQGI